MKERYSRFMDSITPERSNDELFRTVIEKADKKEKIKKTEKKVLKKAVVIPVAAAMALTLSIAGGAAIYNGFSYLRQSEIAQSTEVAENIQTEVFTDSSEHVKISVEEYVSDGLTAIATVKYEAIDDYGKEWLADYNFTKGYDSSKLSLNPCKLVSCSYGKSELEEMRTETERCFTLNLSCCGDGYDSITFRYIMNNYDFREVQFEKCTVEPKSFTLSGEEQASEYFTPTHLKITDLSFVIYGENHGVYDSISFPEANYYSVWSTLPKEESERIRNNINPIIVKTNGERIDLKGYGSGGGLLCSSTPCEENFNTDLMICSSDYSTYDYEKEEYIYRTIETEDIAGIEICGVYFEANEIK